MRINLPSGTSCEIDKTVSNPKMGLVIAPDIFSLRPLFDDLVKRLAFDWQMAVCAVEPFPGLPLGPEIEPRFAAVSSLDDEKHLRDLHDAADALGTAEVGLIGFCLGGMYCFKSARSKRFKKIVSFYGMIKVPDGWKSATQGEPLEYLRTGNSESVLAIIGGKDHYTPPSDVAELAKLKVETQIYPDAEHGFAHDASRPSHRVQDAADAFSRTRAWLLS
ncbi:MAG: dienelactone hydrolase family protein [Ilumatobacteraceae bacterium]